MIKFTDEQIDLLVEYMDYAQFTGEWNAIIDTLNERREDVLTEEEWSDIEMLAGDIEDDGVFWNEEIDELKDEILELFRLEEL